MRIAFLIHFAAIFLTCHSFANIKTLTPKTDEIVDIKTALGIATIVQMPETVQSAISGDSSAYRIEYLDQAVTIKPLRGSAKTNLYLFTKSRRYILRLAVVPQNLANYVVYIKNRDSGMILRWISNGKTASTPDLSLKLLRTSTTSDGFVLLDAEVTAKTSQTLMPGNFWIWQGKDSKPMQSLFLSRKELRKDQRAMIGISIRKADLKNQPVILELQSSSKSLKIEIPKEALWN